MLDEIRSNRIGLSVYETIHEERGDSMERAATTNASLDEEHDCGNILKTQSMATLNEPIPQGTSSSGGSRRVLALENIKTAQDLEITSLKKRVKKLEKKKKERTPQLKRKLFKVMIESSTEKSLGDQEDASKQGRNEIGQDKEISWFQEDKETQGSAPVTTDGVPVTSTSTPITTAGVSVSTVEPITHLTTTILIEDEYLIIAQTLMKMISEKSKEKSKEKGLSSETATTTTTRGVTMQEPSEFGTRKTVPPPQHDPKDKGKGKMIKPEKPSKKKDQIKFVEELAKRLVEEL
ncbi:hypothetical protein Tco_0080161 [Tanacetum coccineum]